MAEPAPPLVLHASAVAVDGRAILIRGASGSGKSSLALALMALGAQLVADDRVIVTARDGGAPWLAAPATIAGLIEARGLGILRAEAVDGAELALVIDLDETETDRLPPKRETVVMNRAVPLLHLCETAYFPAAVLQYIKGGRRD
ncbi:HPr kinase/phosphorylase [Tropicibacter oceani]|uniref:Serine kinase n=1 Tax=Tropicibacter oceani TaxID=3058420 RepID=A0ABY8QKL9_9RHOB|nr:serine kinase [Tropicibacter oceani]WGW05174.1 serine kinase [Tropicibacter oceani]